MFTQEKELEIKNLWKIPSAIGGLLNYPDGVLMQYTGLKDKNGKEIYEGDIAKVHSGSPFMLRYNYEIVFHTSSFCLQPIGFNMNGRRPLSFIYYQDQLDENKVGSTVSRELEVIGNIHENPELLK
jgi:uncharacterized phage protein (TIGR01671 family)